MRNWVLVKVETDQSGLYGWGEATLEWKTKSVVGAVEDLSVLLIGQDPRRIEHLWQIMHRQYFWRGGITNMTAMSGIDQALWDIKGKDLGKPVCELLGGPVRDRLRLYDHLGGGTLEGMYKTADARGLGRPYLGKRFAWLYRCQGNAYSGFRVGRKRKRPEARRTMCRSDA